MAVSKAHQKATNKYIQKNYDRINLTIPKGEREIIRDHALKRKETINSFIKRAIYETIERDNLTKEDI